MQQASIPYEMIFVDDGSSDGTWQSIAEQAEQNSQIRGLRFSRNFGKEGAIFAGLKEARGDCMVVMDCRPAASAGNHCGDVPHLGA